MHLPSAIAVPKQHCSAAILPNTYETVQQWCSASMCNCRLPVHDLWRFSPKILTEAPDAESLEAALREFMEVNVFSEPLPGASVSSDLVQFHYKAVMPASEWEAEWQPMLAHFRRERSGKGREEAAEAVA